MLSTGIIIMLYALHTSKIAGSSGFTRNINTRFVSNLRQVDLGYNSFYIAGADGKYIYLGNSMGTRLILKMRADLTQSTKMMLSVTDSLGLRWQAVTVRVDSPDVYLSEGVQPAILHTTLPSLLPAKPLALDQTYFLSSVPLSPRTFILKVHDTRQQQYVLYKKTSGVPYNTYLTGVLEKQGDGYFSVDGALMYDPQTTHLAYLYYYRNEFIRLDTNLNVIYRAHTIDTTRKAKIKVSEFKSGSRQHVMMSAPPLLVNKQGCLSHGYLFVNSAIKADNESKRAFEQSTVIDVYKLETGSYRFSFYVENYKGKKIQSLGIHGNMLVAIFDQYLCTYTLNFGQLEENRESRIPDDYR